MENLLFDIYIDLTKAYIEKSGDWIVEGIATSVDLDLQSDMILPKAMYKAASDLLLNSTVLYNHDINNPIGRVIVSKVVEAGLFVKLLISKNAPKHWEDITTGVLRKLSIRGRVTDFAKVFMQHFKKFVRVIKSLYLVELSLVPIAANPQAKTLTWYITKSFESNDESKQTLKGGETFMPDSTQVQKKDETKISFAEARREILDILKKLNSAAPNDDAKALIVHAESVLKSVEVKPDSSSGTQAGDTQAGDTQAGDTQAGDTQAGDTQAINTQKSVPTTSNKDSNIQMEEVLKNFRAIADTLTVVVEGQKQNTETIKSLSTLNDAVSELKKAMEQLPVRKGIQTDIASDGNTAAAATSNTSVTKAGDEDSEMVKRFNTIKGIGDPHDKLRQLVAFAVEEQTTVST